MIYTSSYIPYDFISKLCKNDISFSKTKPKKLKFSVVMPCFNQVKFIERSILSILNQDYSNLEFIIIDGGSTDGTVDIIQKYQKHLAYWISESDNGQSDALNKGFARATGDIFGWLNSDDLYLPEAFNVAENIFISYPKKGIIFGDWLDIDVDDQLIEIYTAFNFNIGQFKYEGFHLNAQSMFWRRDVHKRFGGFDVSLHNTMDYQMIVAFGINEGNSSFLRIERAFGCFRRYAEQKTGNFDARVIAEHRSIAARYGYYDKYQVVGRIKRFFYRFRRAYWYFKRGGFVHLFAKMTMRYKR